MKNILKKNWLMIFLPAVMLFSCTKDEIRTILKDPATAPVLSADKTTLVLLQADAANDAVTFTWTEPDYGFNSTENFTLQISVKGTNFSSATTTSVLLARSLQKKFTVLDFNKELLKIISPNIATDIEIRIKSEISNTAAPVLYSNVVGIKATAYRDIITYSYPQALNIAGNYQGWDPGTAPQIVNTNNGGYGGYEGYINFTNATPEFKMVKGNNWGAGDFGSAGPGMLGNGGPNLTLTDGAGVYRIRANTSTMTWSNNKINSWGLIGSATPGGWGSDQDMTFDAGTGTWSITVNLIAGEIKFRANDDWGINLGDNNGDGKPEYDGSNIAISSAGNYTIKLEIGIAGNYAYSIKKN